jgi:hypothetical protein
VVRGNGREWRRGSTEAPDYEYGAEPILRFDYFPCVECRECDEEEEEDDCCWDGGEVFPEVVAVVGFEDSHLAPFE